jgi:hypothetical protein
LEITCEYKYDGLRAQFCIGRWLYFILIILLVLSLFLFILPLINFVLWFLFLSQVSFPLARSFIDSYGARLFGDVFLFFLFFFFFLLVFFFLFPPLFFHHTSLPPHLHFGASFIHEEWRRLYGEIIADDKSSGRGVFGKVGRCRFTYIIAHICTYTYIYIYIYVHICVICVII